MIVYTVNQLFHTHLIHCGTLLHCLGVNACVHVTVTDSATAHAQRPQVGSFPLAQHSTSMTQHGSTVYIGMAPSVASIIVYLRKS